MVLELARPSEAWCFAPGRDFFEAVLLLAAAGNRICRKRCLPVGFLLEQPPAAAAIKIGLDWIRFLVG